MKKSNHSEVYPNLTFDINELADISKKQQRRLKKMRN